MELEHVNLTVTDPEATADFLARVFGWHIRWAGEAMMSGRTVHVGTDQTYLALYTRPGVAAEQHRNDDDRPGLSHIGVLVDDLAATEKRVLAEAIETFSHDSTPPGSRFYFFDRDGILFEAASYN